MNDLPHNNREVEEVGWIDKAAWRGWWLTNWLTG